MIFDIAYIQIKTNHCVHSKTLNTLLASKPTQDTDFYEMFSGCGSLYKAFRQALGVCSLMYRCRVRSDDGDLLDP